MDARPLGRRFVEGLAFATAAHRTQGRKGTDTPYVAHLLAVAAIVLEYGGDEDQAIAGLLHDAVEDQGGETMRRRIREAFGDRVTRMVDDCTDSDANAKPPWKERKLAYLAHIPTADVDSLLVSMADKLHNAGCIVRELRREGAEVFERLSAGPADTAWYYRSLLEAFEARRPEGDSRDLLDDLRHVVEELESAIADLGA